MIEKIVLTFSITFYFKAIFVSCGKYHCLHQMHQHNIKRSHIRKQLSFRPQTTQGITCNKAAKVLHAFTEKMKRYKCCSVSWSGEHKESDDNLLVLVVIFQYSNSSHTVFRMLYDYNQSKWEFVHCVIILYTTSS